MGACGNHAAMKIVRFLLMMLCAAILLLAGYSAGRETCTGIKEKRTMTKGRRVSRLVDQEREPGFFWLAVGANGATSVLFCGGGLYLVYLALRGPRQPAR